MTILKKNKLYRTLAISTFFTKFGASMYNLVFIAFAANMESNKLAVGIANIVVLLPVLLTLFIGIKADETRQKAKWLINLGFLQALLFLLVALLTSSKTWAAFSTVCLINVISDLISDYRGGLELPIFQQNVKQEDLMEAHSFNQFIAYFCNICGQGFGVWILSISNDNFFLIASINALTFLFSAIILLKHKKFLTHPTVELQKQSLKKKILDTYYGLKEVFQESDKSSFNLMLLAILLINALGSGFSSIYNIYFLDKPLWSLSFSQSIFTIQVVTIIFSILGSLTPKDYFAKQSLTTIIFLDAVIIFAIAVNNTIFGNQFLSMSGLAFLFYLGGKINPKLNSMLMTFLPSDMLARSGGFLSLLFMLAMPIGSSLFTICSLLSIQIAWMLYSVISFIVLLLSYKLNKVARV